MKENLEGTNYGVEQQLIEEKIIQESEPAANSIQNNSIRTVQTDETTNERAIGQATKTVSATITQARTGTLTYKSLVSSMILALIIIVLVAAATAGPFSTPRVVIENFVTAPSAMRNIKGSGGSIAEVMGIRDRWVYFESSAPIVLKNQEKYKPIPREEMKWKADFFKIHTPEIDALSDFEHLSGVFCLNGINPVSDQKYLLVNNRTHEYFFSERHVESDGF
ncbi:hypothetical protein BH10CYA1_BH10CYA1_11510 [soil metagenome]